MTGLPISFRPEAVAEFDAAVDWYEGKRPGLGSEFIEQVQEALDKISVRPGAYGLIHRDTRRVVLSRFPYSVIYRLEQDGILVVAVFHARRAPAAWASRT